MHLTRDTISEEWVRERVPLVLPVGWAVHTYQEDGAWWRRRRPRATIAMSGCVELDGKRWFHASIARLDKLPTWEDLVEVKETLFGLEAKAIQVLPPRSQHVNIHDRCLHLFHCVDGDALPDFTKGGGTL